MDLQDLINKKINQLEIYQNYSGDINNNHAGWYRELTNRTRIGYVATAQAVLCLTSTNRSIPKLSNILLFFKDNQLSDGSWPFVSNINTQGVVDSTAWVALALLSLPQNNESFLNLNRTIHWLKACQNKDGGWGIVANGESRIISTALSLLVLKTQGLHDEELQSAERFLYENQNGENGSWKNIHKADCVASTCYAMLALSKLNNHAAKQALDRSANWLINQSTSNNFWEDCEHTEEIEHIGQQITRFPFLYPVTPLAIRALIESKIDFPNKTSLIEKYCEHIKDGKKLKGILTNNKKDSSYGFHDLIHSIICIQATNRKKEENNTFIEKIIINKKNLPILYKVAHKTNQEEGLDIVFVHGLDGDAIETWYNSTSKLSLINQLAKQKTIRNVFSFAYNCPKFSFNLGNMEIHERASTLYTCLKNNHQINREIIFIGHSYGGLLIKALIKELQLDQSTESKKMFASIAGVCFIATPHHGSKLAASLSKINICASKITRILGNTTPALLDLNREYKIIAHKIKHISFIENEKTWTQMVVDKKSADIDIPGSERVITDKNHIEICKPDSTNSIVLQTLENFIMNLKK